MDANVSGGNHTVGMAFSGNDIADAMCIANAMGGYIDRWIENPDGTMSWSTLAPEVKAAWAKMNEWYEEGILDPQFGTRTTEDINAMMINNAGHRLWRMAYPRLASEQRQGPGAGGRVHRLYGGR